MNETNTHFQEEILTADAAKKYRLTPSYVARLARTSLVQARKFGRDWILDEASLREYLAQPRKPGPKSRKQSESQDYVGDKDRQTIQVDYGGTPPEKLVVGIQHGESLDTSTTSYDLYSLASSNANWLMQLAGVDCFAVDDMITLTHSHNFAGWSQHDICTTTLSTPLPVPFDIEEVRQKKLPAIERNFTNSSHYRLYSYTPAFSDRKGLEVSLAPIGFHDYYTLMPFLDDPLLTNLDGSHISIRQKYGNTALTYSSTDERTCLIPAPISLQCVVVTRDRQIVLMQRSPSVAIYPNHWSVSFEGTMNSPGLDPRGNPGRPGDADFFACAIRGFEEEFGVSANAITGIRILSLNIEYLTLSVGVIATITVDLTAEEVKRNWLLKARDKNEASRFGVLPEDLDAIVDTLFSKILWHPTSRMRLVQFLFHTYGIDETARAIKERKA